MLTQAAQLAVGSAPAARPGSATSSCSPARPAARPGVGGLRLAHVHQPTTFAKKMIPVPHFFNSVCGSVAGKSGMQVGRRSNESLGTRGRVGFSAKLDRKD